MVYRFLLAFHIIGFIVWMAGLFYWVRIMVYQSETETKEVFLQLQIMSERLYRIIIIPGMILTWGMGIALMVITQAYLYGWFHFKFFLITILIIYQFYGRTLMLRCRKAGLTTGINTYLPSSKWLRIYNEFATFLMVGVVCAVVLQNFLWIMVGYGGFTLLLIAGFGGYWIKRGREKRNKV